jgi:hypothetical protein
MSEVVGFSESGIAYGSLLYTKIAPGLAAHPGSRVYPQIRMAAPFREEPPRCDFSRNGSLRRP